MSPDEVLRRYGATYQPTEAQTEMALQLTQLLGDVHRVTEQLRANLEGSERDRRTLASMGLGPISRQNILECGTAD
jgi:transposase